MNKKYKNLNVTIEDAICTIVINKPETLNALNSEILGELYEAVSEIESSPNIKVTIITGTGRSFVAGADISEMVNFRPTEAAEFGAFGAKVFRKIEQLHCPVIAAINGFALGGGCELAMACDIRIASEKAKLGQPETGLGIIPGFSGTQRLTRLVGPAKAKELIFNATNIRAEEALKIGLVNSVVPHEELMETSMEMAKTIAKRAHAAVEYSKKAINRGAETDIDTAIEYETGLFALCFDTEDQKQRMNDFLTK